MKQNRVLKLYFPLNENSWSSLLFFSPELVCTTTRAEYINLFCQTPDGFQLAAFQHHYIRLRVLHSQGERGKIHRAFTLIGVFTSETESEWAVLLAQRPSAGRQLDNFDCCQKYTPVRSVVSSLSCWEHPVWRNKSKRDSLKGSRNHRTKRASLMSPPQNVSYGNHLLKDWMLLKCSAVRGAECFKCPKPIFII